MQSETIPVEELRQLLAGVSDHGTQHLLEVEADLMQTTYLLSEAIEKLGACFMSVHEAVTAQQQELDLLLQQTKLPAEQQQKLLQYREHIAKEVNTAVTGLQFQDLTSQLIARTIKRVNGLKELLSALATHGDSMDSEQEHQEIARLLQEMNRSLNSRSVELSGGLRKAVDQHHMGSGEIELF